MAAYGKELNTAEIAYAAIDEVCFLSINSSLETIYRVLVYFKKYKLYLLVVDSHGLHCTCVYKLYIEFLSRFVGISLNGPFPN